MPHPNSRSRSPLRFPSTCCRSGSIAEAQDAWLGRALDATPDEPSRGARVALHRLLFARLAGDVENAKRLRLAAVEAARPLDDPYLLGRPQRSRCSGRAWRRTRGRGRGSANEALDAARASGDAELIGTVTGNLGVAAGTRGDWDTAHSTVQRSTRMRPKERYESFAPISISRWRNSSSATTPSAVAARYAQIYQRASEDQEPHFAVGPCTDSD